MITILIGDDNPGMLDTLVSILQLPDFVILGTASSGQWIFDQISVLNPDIVITDISLGDLTGFEVLRASKKIGHTSKFIFVSVHESASFVNAAKEMGASGYVFKSQLSRDMVATLKAVVQGVPFTSSRSDDESRAIAT
jgi:DNA-binding NarL/FixJ family response regulator